jgi:methylenetetrahydrofolate reductase (NADPH)
MIDAVSFKAWREEAFSIWNEWRRIYHPRSPSAQLLTNVAADAWLVNIVHHDFIEKEALWNLLISDS